MNKEEKKLKDMEKEAAENQGAQELSDEEMDHVSGGGAFDSVPCVKEHDYTEDVKKRV